MLFVVELDGADRSSGMCSRFSARTWSADTSRHIDTNESLFGPTAGESPRMSSTRRSSSPDGDLEDEFNDGTGGLAAGNH